MIPSPTLVLSMTVVSLCFITLNHLLSPLRSFDGPWLAQFTSLWRLVDVYKGKADKTQRELHKRYGTAVRIGPNCLSLNDHRLIKTIYATRNPWHKSEFYAASDTVVQGKIVQGQFATRDEQWHDYLVRPIRGAYSLGSVLQLEHLMDEALDYLVEKLDGFESQATRRKQCDLGELLHQFAWDVIGQLTFSERLGALDEDPLILQLLQDGRKAIDYLGVIGQMPILDKLFKNPVFPIGPRGFKIAAEWGAGKLVARLSGADKRSEGSQRDFADLFIDAENEVDEDGKGAPMTQRQMGWLITNSVAGSDTVAVTLQAAVYYICRRPEVRDRLVAELDGAIGGVDRRLTWKQCQKLPYLDAVIKETLRIAPSIGLPLERIVPDGGLLLPDGRRIPGGVVVGVNPRVVNHDEDTFGPNADRFVPERWLRASCESEGEHAARLSRMKDADFTFGFGNRGCIGRNIVMLELYKSISRLFTTFKISLMDPSAEWTVVSGWIVKQYGINVYVQRRDSQRGQDAGTTV